MNFSFILWLIAWVQIPIPPPHSNKKALSKDKAFLFGRKIGL
jgi:hypothetical protein